MTKVDIRRGSKVQGPMNSNNILNHGTNDGIIKLVTLMVKGNAILLLDLLEAPLV
jgi:hypothetical protein